jgi:glucokinase
MGDVSLTAGVDLGGTKVLAVVARDGEILGRAKSSTPRTGPEHVADAIVASLDAALAGTGIPEATLGSVGIGAPGRADGGMLSHAPNIPGLRSPFPMAHAVSERLGDVPVVIENDVTVATIGEQVVGAGRPYGSFLGVFVGTGVGGGLVLDGQVYTGRGAGAEIGHVVVDPKGRRCGCGGTGHLEAYAGKAGIEAEARRRADQGERTLLVDLTQHAGKDRLTSGTIGKALRAGDPVATALIDDAMWAMSVALATAQNLLDVEAIVIGGGLADKLGPGFVTRVAELMKPQLFVPEHAPQVVPSELGDLSGATGALVLAGRLSPADPTP